MKICLIGPVNSDEHFGGVALFTESLADGFLSLGHEVLIVSDYTDKGVTLGGVKIKSISTKPSRRNLFRLSKIRKHVEQFEPDLVISSLEYSAIFLKKINSDKSIKYLHFLHGFPSIKHYGLIKLTLMLILDRMIGKKFDLVLTNSNFSYVINQEIYNNRVDGIVNLGINYNDKISKKESVLENQSNRKNNIIFIGRLVKAKNVDRIIHSINYVRDKYNVSLNLHIVGDGPEMDNLKSLSNKLNVNVNFIGAVSPEKVNDYYEKAEIFISLNPHEPFGIVYLEALSNNCKIVCPNTGGQVDFLNDYKNNVEYVKTQNVYDIGDAIFKVSNNESGKIIKKDFLESHNYILVAKKILGFLS